MYDLLLMGCITGFVLLTVGAAVSDVATMTIPNTIPLALVGMFAVAVMLGPLDVQAIAWHAGAGLLVFAVTIGLFALGLIGGGDAKLMPAIALWIGPAALMPFVFHTAMAGGLLAVTFLILRRLPQPSAAAGTPWLSRLLDKSGGIPYGVAIAYGALVAATKAPLVTSILG
jgi:prepilin peptidase CpaA